MKLFGCIINAKSVGDPRDPQIRAAIRSRAVEDCLARMESAKTEGEFWAALNGGDFDVCTEAVARYMFRLKSKTSG